LLDNAINYSDPDKRIIVKAEPGTIRTEMVVSVHDEGIGIAPEHLGRLFERFYRLTSPAAASSGHRLGLSIVKHIALAHGGRVAVESMPGNGSTFYIVLPRWRNKMGSPIFYLRLGSLKAVPMALAKHRTAHKIKFPNKANNP